MKKEIVKKTLSNGVVAYLYSDKNLKRVVASYNVNYGFLGYYDKFYYKDKLYTAPVAMAHFLEHTLVETAKNGNLFLKFKEKNYEMNAKTSPELTTFYFVGIKDTWASIKDLIEMIDKPNFDAENIERVKNAIVEEANQTMNDTYRHGYNANKRNAFKAFDATHKTYSTLGTPESTRKITLEDVKTCYDAYYYDSNKFLVIGGNFKIEEMVDYLEEIYKDIPPHEDLHRECDYGDLLPIRKPYEELVRPVAMDHTIVTYKLRNDLGYDNLTIDLYLSIYLRMKFTSSTEFVAKLNAEGIIVGGIGYDVDFFKDVISVKFAVDTLNEQEFLKRLSYELDLNGLDEKMFELIKRNMKVGELSKMDAIYGTLLRFSNNVWINDKLYMMDILDNFTLSELKNLIKKIDWDLKTVTVIRKK